MKLSSHLQLGVLPLVYYSVWIQLWAVGRCFCLLGSERQNLSLFHFRASTRSALLLTTLPDNSLNENGTHRFNYLNVWFLVTGLLERIKRCVTGGWDLRFQKPTSAHQALSLSLSVSPQTPPAACANSQLLLQHRASLHATMLFTMMVMDPVSDVVSHPN